MTTVVDAALGVPDDMHGPLNALSRCDDTCSSQAFVRVTVQSGILLFCGHHYVRHQVALMEHQARIEDFRDQINKKPSVSANV